LNLTNIQLAGFVSEEEKLLLLRNQNTFFFPSYEEGWGIALAEALYCECRCICYELPHYRSIFGDFPIYARLGDADDFTRAFQQSGEVSYPNKKIHAPVRRPTDRPATREHLAPWLKAHDSSSSGLAAR